MNRPIIDKINQFIGVDGILPFEHGYKNPIITIDGKKEKVYYVAYNEIKTMYSFYIPLDMIDDDQLEILYSEMVKYVDYCVNEA